MPDEAQNDQNQQGDATDGEKGTAEEQRIPYTRFEEVNKRAKQAEQELQDLRTKILEFEDRDKTEVERAKARAERAESQLDQLAGKVTSLEKGAWVRSAAAELDFHDPEDAVMHLHQQLTQFEDPRDAKRAVKNLASSRKHLLRAEKPAERPQIGRVFSGDQAQPQGGQNGQQRSPQQMAADRELQFAQEIAAGLNQFRDKWNHVGGIS